MVYYRGEEETAGGGDPDVGAATAAGDLGGGGEGEACGEFGEEFGVSKGWCDGLVGGWGCPRGGSSYFSRRVLVLVMTSPYMNMSPQVSASVSFALNSRRLE